MEDAELAAIQDADAGLVEHRAAELGTDAPTYTDYREMLADTHPDFVIVLGRHSDMAIAAHFLLDEGYPFLIEKPAGLNAGEVEAVAAKAAEKHAFAAVPLFQRLHPFVSHAYRMFAGDQAGAVSHFYFRSNRPSSARYVEWGAPWMLDPLLSGGGCLRNVGLHGIDLFLHLTGEDAQVTGAELSARALGQRVEDYATIVLRTPSGIVGTIEVGNTFPGKGGDAEWRLSARDALLTQRGGMLRRVTPTGELELPDEISTPLPALALRDALTRWRKDRHPAMTVADCARAMRVVDDAYKMSTIQR
jgi:predicted dehydrogenase